MTTRNRSRTACNDPLLSNRMIALLGILALWCVWTYTAPAVGDRSDTRASDEPAISLAWLLIPAKGPTDKLTSDNAAKWVGKGSTNKHKYLGDKATEYNVSRVKTSADVNIGQVDFLFRLYYDRSGGKDGGGAQLVGGFTANNKNPCEPGEQQQGAEYFWVQTVTTNVPHTNRGNNFINKAYVDAPNPGQDPAYPYSSPMGNTAGEKFTGRSYYDLPYRRQPPADGEKTVWNARNILACRVPARRKINLIGGFTWGYTIQPGDKTDGEADIAANAPGPWGDATAAEARTFQNEAVNDQGHLTWTISAGGACCGKPPAPTYDNVPPCPSGRVWMTVGIDSVMDEVVLFPRFTDVAAYDPPAPGWSAQPWDGGWGSSISPPLPGDEPGDPGLLMYRNGVHLVPAEPIVGPVDVLLHLALDCYDPFVDLFVHDAVTGQWEYFSLPSQELFGDMNGDGMLTLDDLLAWDLAFNDPDAYAGQYPGLDPILRGDIDLDGKLTPNDRILLEYLIVSPSLSDAQESAHCTGDLNGDHVVDVLDLLIMLDTWGPVPGGHPADVNGDEVVDVLDLLIILDAWGPCVYDTSEPTGACCFTLACGDMTAQACAIAGGVYFGDGTVCGGDICPPVAKPCCFASGECALVTAQECLAAGGRSHGPLDDCSVCPQPKQACVPPDCIPPGDDCWTTACDGTTGIDFKQTPIPAGFFGPGSDPYTGPVFLGGEHGPEETDTTIRRLDDLDLSPPLPAADTVPIEIVQLDLVSCQPIIVTYNGGQNPEQWNVRVNLSDFQPTQGEMTVTKDSPGPAGGGGTFDSHLDAFVRMEFTKVNDPTDQRVLDTGDPDAGIPPIPLLSHGSPWRYDDLIGTACDPNFVPGSWPGSTCCVPVCHSAPPPLSHQHCMKQPWCPHCEGLFGACCFGTVCIDGLPMDLCQANGGVFMGPDTFCPDVECPGGDARGD